MPDQEGRRGDAADNSVIKEKPAMKARPPKEENGMTELRMRSKEPVALAVLMGTEMMTMEMARHEI